LSLPAPPPQWEATVGKLERAEMTWQRTGRPPVKRTGCCCSGDRVEVIPMLQVRPGHAGAAAAPAPRKLPTFASLL
jgi:hypothetical protein